MIADTLISPKSDQSFRTRYSAMKRRTGPGSSNFRDILRQRCRERVKSRRSDLFDRFRSLKNEESVRVAISQFIEMDFREIKSPSMLEASTRIEDDDMEEFDDAPLSQLAVTEQEKWILEEYEKMIENTNTQAELADMVTCPVCSHGVLKLDEGKQLVDCSLCTLLLPWAKPLADLEQRIIQVVDVHSQYCREHPQFTVCPEETTSCLLLLCSECGHCHQIV